MITDWQREDGRSGPSGTVGLGSDCENDEPENENDSVYDEAEDNSTADRLIILPSDDDPSLAESLRGRPIDPEYSSTAHKIDFMDAHNIDISVISLANPWLDFLDPASAAETAREINDNINDECGKYPDRLYAFGTLPLSASIEKVVAEIRRLKSLKYMRGIIMGTSGLGAGLDDPMLEAVWAALQETKTLLFLHPHYGLPNEVYGPRAGEYGHVLPLALGFPMETTIAVARMLVAGVFDRFTELQVLLAHSGGTLPFLAGRIESCILHDGRLKKDGKLDGRRSVWEVLKKNIYLDAVIYGDVGMKSAIAASGADRMMFGTDHPFFPPLGQGETEWLSVKMNSEAIRKTFEGDDQAAAAVMGGNAVRVLGIES